MKCLGRSLRSFGQQVRYQRGAADLRPTLISRIWTKCRNQEVSQMPCRVYRHSRYVHNNARIFSLSFSHVGFFFLISHRLGFVK